MAGILSNDKYARYYQSLNLIYQKPEIKASLEVILSVFMVTTLIFVAIKPTLTNIAGLQKKITDQETMNTKADKKIGQLFIAQAQLSEYQNKLPLFDKAVGNKFSYYEMFSRIELIAQRNDILVETMSAPGTQIAGKNIVTSDLVAKVIKPQTDGSLTVEISLTFFGEPKNVQKFLREIENMDVLTMIRSVVFIKEPGGSKNTNRLKVNIPLQFYFLPTPNET